MISIENDYLKASFNTKGAELIQLTGKETKLDYLWNGDTKYWAKHSPILFPIIGGLKEGKYYYKNEPYHLPKHGFARDMNFNLDKKDSTEIQFSLSSTPDTLKIYPFEFKLVIQYQLVNDRLNCNYWITNLGNHQLLFSVGGHPAFACPTGNTIQYQDYYLQFNHVQQLTTYKIKHDLLTGENSTLNLIDGKLSLKHELFYHDALIFKNLKSDQISLLNRKNKHGIHFRFKDFTHFGIWAAKDADFICLEPWCGINDSISHNQNLEEKEGIIYLGAKEEWTRSWAVECF